MKIQEVERVLKNIYLEVVRTQLDNVNPFYAIIRKSSDKVQGKDIIHYVNGEEVRTPLQNLYFTIEIPQKAIDRCYGAASAVELINSEINDTIYKHKESMQKALWQSNNETEIIGLPCLLKNATIVKNKTKLTNTQMYEMLDKIEESGGKETNMIFSSYERRRAYISYLASARKNIDYMSLHGGYKALSFNGIPFVAEKYLTSNATYFINTNDFELQQLCDWMWLEDDNGSILRQNGGNYTATLVKYANLICLNPKVQGILMSETVEVER